MRPSLIGSQQASGVSSGMIAMPWPRGWAYRASGLVVLVAGSSVVAKPRTSGGTVMVCWAQQAWARLSSNCVSLRVVAGPFS